MALGEFDLIERYFTRRPRRSDVLLGVGDDAALLEVPPGRALVAATDTLVEGRHFLADAPARSVGHQALAVNLSDLAAMGADPAWALLSLSIPEVREDWLAEFAAGLYALADAHGVELVGGDTVRGPLVVTVQALGFVDPAVALKRSGAQPGDLVYVSGTPGEAAAGLAALRRGARLDEQHPLQHRYLYAEPRLALGRALRGRATAAMDVSDGLLGDLGKLCAASRVGATVELDALPVSAALRAAHGREECEQFVLSGGDDYELLFTLPAAEAGRYEVALRKTLAITRIGRIVAGHAVRCERAGVAVDVASQGYDHFA
ncbi:MAG TPA: thiamine-phosphate kinase [Steroidobacteraceae bacterium]|nr:thiamine-phosphate kinase [Steroidobacteraceae bacterium]